MFGWIAVPITPPIRMWTPITASSSAWVQPARLSVWSKTRARTASAGDERDQRLERAGREVRPVLQLVQGADPEEDPEQAERAEQLARRLGRRTSIAVTPSPSSADRREAPDRAPPGQRDRRRADRDPRELHREPAEELLGR